MAVDGKEGSEKAGGGTEGSMLVSGTFASRSEDRRSSEAEVDGAWDSFWLEITIGGSKGENSEAKGTPGEAAFLLRKAVIRMRSLRFVEGDLVFF